MAVNKFEKQWDAEIKVDKNFISTFRRKICQAIEKSIKLVNLLLLKN